MSVLSESGNPCLLALFYSSALRLINHIDYIAQEKNINHAGDLLVAELGKEAYQNYPFLYVTCNSSGACGDNVRPGDGGGSSYSTISEAANSSGMLFIFSYFLYFVRKERLVVRALFITPQVC
jgi:hypothetical protein